MMGLATGSADAGARSTTPAGYRRVDLASAGLSVLAPTTWTTAELGQTPVDTFVRAIARTGSSRATLLRRGGDALTAAGVFAAVGPAAVGFSDQLTIVARSSSDNTPSLLAPGSGEEAAALQQQILSVVGSDPGAVAVTAGQLDRSPAAVATATVSVGAPHRAAVRAFVTGYRIAIATGSLELSYVGHRDPHRDGVLRTVLHGVTLAAVTEAFSIDATVSVTASAMPAGAENTIGTATGPPLGSTSLTSIGGPGSQPPACGSGGGATYVASVNFAGSNGDILNALAKRTGCQSGTTPAGAITLLSFTATGTFTLTGSTGCFQGGHVHRLAAIHLHDDGGGCPGCC